ncbi:MAG: hypothetical protein AAF975_05635 [Spirochaetota bacterium]
MDKFYIAVENDKVVANWGQGPGPIDPEMTKKYSDIREVATDKSVAFGFPLCCYDEHWQPKSAGELKKLGYDIEGKKLPTAEELAAQKAREQKAKQLQKDLGRLLPFLEFNKNYASRMLEPEAEKLAQTAYDPAKTVFENSRAVRAKKKQILSDLKKTNAKLLADAEKRAKAYQVKFDAAQKEWEKLQKEQQK